MSRIPGSFLVGLVALSLPLACHPTSTPAVDDGGSAETFRTGLEVLARDGFGALASRRVGVVTNATGVDSSLRSTIDLIAEAPGVQLAALFGPEHGVRGAAEAGEKVGDRTDPRTGVPVYSLYGRRRRPEPETLEGIDVLVFDIQDVGVRAYTYLSTLVEILEAAASANVEVWVLDRPVPIRADVLEGPVLEEARRSFVGAHRVPLRHGLTAGEFARMVCGERGIEVALKVVPMEGYRRSDWLDSRAPLWIAPSPNIPDRETALVYAGMVLVEGTNLSEGRGTTRPFRLVGAPWIDDAPRLASELDALGLGGVRFRPAAFEPQYSKHASETCRGVRVHVIDRDAYRSVAVAVAVIASVRRLWPEAFRFRESAFDRLAGTSRLRESIEAGRSIREIESGWESDLAAYRERRAKHLLYR